MNHRWSNMSRWFLTDSGKQFSFIASGVAATVGLFGYYVPHTFMLEHYKNFVHLYQDGFAVKLPKHLQDTFQKALELVEVSEGDRYLFKPFLVSKYDLFSAGTSISEYGVAIGLPINFTYEDIDSIDKHAIMVEDQSVAWDLPEARKLLESFVMSENAKLYAMAREIKFRQSPKPIIDSVSAMVTVSGMYGLANTLNNHFHLYRRPLKIRLFLYGLVGLFGLTSFLFVKDGTQVYYEGKVDKELSEKSEIFKEGGKEFYTKMLQRNLALRKLMGKQGESAFTASGNENYLIRYKHIPLFQRRMMFE